MRKGIMFLSALILSSTIAMAPANAQDDGSQATSQKTTNALEEVALFPVRLVAVPTAFVFGTPISVLAKEAQLTADYCESVSQEYDEHGVSPLMVASVPGQLIRLVGGVGEGVYKAAENSLSGFETPFSAKSFSMDDDD